MHILRKFFCTVMISIALSASDLGGHHRVRSPQAVVLTEPPALLYPPRAIAWKPRRADFGF